mmetsp:Transcript_9089/g.30033  ORF Transcript_9089/g.30033 Transcript_9089/m.30033 type:complete len:243 (-) Transcript_9089:945-1673(-)
MGPRFFCACFNSTLAAAPNGSARRPLDDDARCALLEAATGGAGVSRFGSSAAEGALAAGAGVCATAADGAATGSRTAGTTGAAASMRRTSASSSSSRRRLSASSRRLTAAVRLAVSSASLRRFSATRRSWRSFSRSACCSFFASASLSWRARNSSRLWRWTPTIDAGAALGAAGFATAATAFGAGRSTICCSSAASSNGSTIGDIAAPGFGTSVGREGVGADVAAGVGADSSCCCCCWRKPV